MELSQIMLYIVLVGVILGPLWLMITGVPALLPYIYLFTPRQLDPLDYTKTKTGNPQ